MKNYGIKINIEIVECENNDENIAVNGKGGGFDMNISESDACSIDKCEGALLRSVQQAIRQALSDHLGDLSKKKLLKTPKQECK